MSVKYIAEMINLVLDRLMESTHNPDNDQDEFTKMFNL